MEDAINSAWEEEIYAFSPQNNPVKIRQAGLIEPFYIIAINLNIVAA
jgi:hypothetical protein